MNPNASREILWNIPIYIKYTMYFSLFVSLGLTTLGFSKKLKFLTNGIGLKDFISNIPKNLQWKNFFKTLFLSGKVPRFKEVAKFHGPIFFGFIILWIATDLVAIHADTPFQIFKGPVYIIVSFLADFAAIAILAGLSMAYKRRYIDKPSYLKSTKPNDEKFMYIMLSSLVILGLLIEGLRIAGTGMPVDEKIYSPIGYTIALFFNSLSLSDTSMAYTYRTLWVIHMFNTMAFIVSLGYSKFSHIIILPFQALITKPLQGAILSPMDFEDESAETFGLGKISELTFKNKLDLISCVECGRCTQVCPANNSGKPLDPKMIVTKLRDFSLPMSQTGNYQADFWENPLYSSSELDSCTTCGACMEECPANIEHVNLILNLKRYKTLTLGEIPPAAADAANKVKINGNPWGITQDDRFKWADGLDVPVANTEEHIDFLYYVGCAGSYDSANQQVVKDTISLLKKANVKFAVIGKEEKCNGDPVRRFGDEYTFFEIAIENIEMLNKYKFDKVVTHCPHCLHTIGKEYEQFENGNFETIHHSELLADLLKAGKLKPEKTIDQEITFHDPCYLGRHHGQYDAPRDVLKSIPGLKINEMEKNKDNSTCCGMGGGNMWYEIEEGQHLAHNRLVEIAETKTQKLATACSYCMINFGSSKAQVNETENMEIEDIATLLSKSIS